MVESVTVLFVLFGALALVKQQAIASELLILVENPGGEVLRENVTTFGQQVVITFEKPDSTVVTVWYDYDNGVQAFRFFVNGEEELNQGGMSRSVCYAIYFDRDSLVPVNAMYKLRQRNTQIVRFAELDKDKEELYFDVKIVQQTSHALSSQIAEHCSDSKYIYTRQSDVESWIAKHGTAKLSSLQTTTVQLNPNRQVFCSQNPAPWAPCNCRLAACVLWYPCALRFCENSGVCGIRTCSKCYHMVHTEENRQHCIE